MLLRCPSVTVQGLGSNEEGLREQRGLSKAALGPIYCYLTHPRKAEPDISLESQTIYHSNFHYSKKKRSREKREKKGKKIKKKKKRHYFSELHATFIILPEVPHRDCVEGRKMKTAVEVLGYTAAPSCLWPLPTSAVCSNPGRECPYLLLLAKASLLPLGIIKTVVCLSAKLLRQLQKVIKSAKRLGARGCHSNELPKAASWDSSAGGWGLCAGRFRGWGNSVPSPQGWHYPHAPELPFLLFIFFNF